jgi:hypothetical protein
MVKSLVYIKIHKCSSTSIRDLIEDCASKNNLKCVKQRRPGPINWWENCKNDKWDLNNPPYNVFARHQPYDIDFFKNFMESPIYVTFLRNPLERAISCYYSQDVPPYNSTISFEQWYATNKLTSPPSLAGGRLVLTHNFMSYMLGFYSLKEINADNLRKRYRFIGFTECFNESVKKLEDVLGWKFNKKLIDIKIRKNKNKPKIVLSEKFKNTFKENNDLDYKLYQLSKEVY